MPYDSSILDTNILFGSCATMVTTVNEMEKKISSLIERFKYVKACFCDSDVLALETVRLSKEEVQEEFHSSSRQKEYPSSPNWTVGYPF